MSSDILDIRDATAPTAITSTPYITFDEYLTLGEDSVQSEWIDGKVIFTSPNSATHQRIGSFLEKLMSLYVEVNGLGEVFRSPFAMKLEKQRRGREPDLLFVRKERMDMVKATYLDGPADLAVEIISPESIGRDRGEKYLEYEKAGIAEFWLLDPDREREEFYELGADGLYHLAAVPNWIFRSKVLEGFFIRTDWLRQTPAPTIEALRELKLMA